MNKLTEIRERCNKATPIFKKPAHVDKIECEGKAIHYTNIFHDKYPGRLIAQFWDDDNHRNDSEFYCQARNDIQLLLNLIELLIDRLWETDPDIPDRMDTKEKFANHWLMQAEFKDELEQLKTESTNSVETESTNAIKTESTNPAFHNERPFLKNSKCTL